MWPNLPPCPRWAAPSLSNLFSLLQKHPAPVCFPHHPFPPAKCYFLTLNKHSLLWPGHMQHSCPGTQAQNLPWCAVSRMVKPHQKQRANQAISSKTVLSADLSSGFRGHLPLFMHPINLTEPWHVLHRWESQSKNRHSGFPSSCRTSAKAEREHQQALVSSGVHGQPSLGKLQPQGETYPISLGRPPEHSPGSPAPGPARWCWRDGQTPAALRGGDRAREGGRQHPPHPSLAAAPKVFPPECLPDDNRIPFIYIRQTRSQGG